MTDFSLAITVFFTGRPAARAAPASDPSTESPSDILNSRLVIPVGSYSLFSVICFLLFLSMK